MFQDSICLEEHCFWRIQVHIVGVDVVEIEEGMMALKKGLARQKYNGLIVFVKNFQKIEFSIVVIWIQYVIITIK